MTKHDLSVLIECNSKSPIFLESAADYSKEIWLISDDSEAIRQSIRFLDRNQSGFFFRSLKSKSQFADIFSDGFKSVKPCAIILDPSFENNYRYFILELMRERAKEQGILFIFLAGNLSDLSYFSLFGLSADIFVAKPADDILLSYILEKSKINYQR